MNPTINEIQQILFKILCDIDDYCKKNNITYFLSGGSCLGAVRHNGFIPWDDDADIMMPRSDFDRFMEGFAAEYNTKYSAGSMKLDPEWSMPFGKVWDISTIAYRKNFNMKSIGVFVDIFPIDGLPNDAKKQKKLYSAIKKHNIMRHAALRITVPKEEKWRIIKSIIGVYCRKKGARHFAEKMESEVLKYKFEDSEYVAVSMACHYGERETIHKSCMADSKEMVFNGKNLPVPVGYDTYLSNLYGDYMKIPKDAGKIENTHLNRWIIKIKDKE